MKIKLNKAIVEFIPENEVETAELEALWVRMGNCVGDNKSLVPIGTYVPAEKNLARFHMNGLSEQETRSVTQTVAPYDTDVYCPTCNRVEHVKKGEPIPVCCGKVMEILD